GDQIPHSRVDHHDYSAAVRRLRDRPSLLDGIFPGVDGDYLLPVRLHHRYLGRWLGEAADRPRADRHAAGLPRWQLLLHRNAAAAVAEDHAVQPGGVPDQRLPLELLWRFRCERGGQPGHDFGLSGAVPGVDRVDIQNGVSVEEL